MTSDTATVTPAQKVDEVDPVQALNKKLIRQVEFYFSDFNLHKDKFMQEHMKKDDGWFTMDTMLQFQRLSSLCSEPGTILAALKTSTKELLELDVENLRIRRHPNNPLPENDAQFNRDLKLRTVHVSGFPQTETIDELTDFLEEYGNVDGIKLMRYADKSKGSIHKGALFVSYSKYEEAERFIQAPMVYYKDKPLEKMSRNDFYESKKNSNNGNRKEKNEKGKEESSDSLAYLYVDGLDDEMITHQDLKSFWEEMGAPSFKFFYRFGTNKGTDAYVVMSSEEDATESLRLFNETKGDNEGITLKSATKVNVSALPEDKKEAAVESYTFMRQRFLTKKGSRQGGNKFNKNRRGNKRNQHIHFDNDDASDAKQAKVEE